MTLFRDRKHAGQVLAALLRPYARQPDVLVLALPRGGVPVAAVIARELHAPLDTFLVRKLGVPGQEELAMGAIASGGIRVLNEVVIGTLGITDDVIDKVAIVEQRELERREHHYRDDRPRPDVHGRTVLLVDDGLATGSTMRAAVAALRRMGPTRIVVAVPLGAPQTCAEMAQRADDVVCARTPDPLIAVGAWYRDFTQTTDEEVTELLREAAERDAVCDGA